MTDKYELPNASASGTFNIGRFEIHRLGFGAMRITGPGFWGPPEDRAEALRTLRRLPELGVNFIDTANSYGPDISETLIREALHPYDGILVATKAGLTRSGPDRWEQDGRPDRLIAETKRSLRKLGVDQIGLWQLHRIDTKVPREEQFDAVRLLLDEGFIANAGLSEVSTDDLGAALAKFPVATVQNLYNLGDRSHETMLELCEAHGIGFIPWFPLASGKLTETESVLGELTRRHHATPAQLALAWLLRRSRVMLPIPGTSKVAHLEENVAASAIRLSDEDFRNLDRVSLEQI